MTTLMLEDLLKYSQKIIEKNLVIGPGGNTSIREGEYMLVTPSGIPFDEMSVEDFVKVKIDDGTRIPHVKGYRPTSETDLHLYIYRARPEVNCIIHAHPPYTTALATSGIGIQHLYPDSVVYLGPKILTLDYIIPTTTKIAEYVQKNIANYLAIVLKNHGAITVGDNPKIAFLRMETLEGLANVLWIVLSSGKKEDIAFLTEQQVKEILDLDAEKYRQKLLEPG